jgi:CxxC-x17-CxxC domain-containing protein
MKKQSKNETDIVAMIAKLQEQVAQLDRKLDSLIMKCSSQPKSPQPPKHDHQQPRPMYKITCADCKRDSEIPFKPAGDRPVYCPECFRRRKTMNAHKPVPDSRPQAVSPAGTIISASSAVPVPAPKEKKKPSAARKVAVKKPVSKRKK